MPIKPVTIEGMSGLSLDHPTLIKDNEFADTQNMVQGSDGLWENRQGIKSFDNAVGSSKKVHSLHFWKPSAGGTRYLTVGSGTVLYSYAESSAYNDGSFTSEQTGFTDGDPFEFAQYKDNLIATNGTESMYSTTDNDTWTQRNGANTRVANYIHFANDIGYCGDVSGARSTLYYGSAVPANPWEFANGVEIEADNGQVLTGLTNLGPIVVAGKEGSIYDVDVATPKREQLDYGQGIISHRSIVKAENSVFFASEDGIFSLAQREGTTGSLAATPISDPIQNLWDNLVNKSLINGIYYPPKKVAVWAVETAEQNYLLVYNVRFNTWSYFVGANALDWVIYEDGNSPAAFHLLFGDANTDYVRELFHENRDDDGAPINSVLTTKRYNFGTNELKRLGEIVVSGYGSDLMELEVEVYIDDEETPIFSSTITNAHFTASTSFPAGSLASGPLAAIPLTGSIASSSDLEVFPWVYKIPFLDKEFRTVQIKLSNYQAGVRWRFRNTVVEVDGQPEDLFEDDFIA